MIVLAVVIFQTDSFSVDVLKREIWRLGIDLDLIAHIFPMIFCYRIILLQTFQKVNSVF
jgi:hypothetical protein